MNRLHVAFIFATGITLLLLLDQRYRREIEVANQAPLIDAVADIERDLNRTLSQLVSGVEQLHAFTPEGSADKQAFASWSAELANHPALSALFYLDSERIVHRLYASDRRNVDVGKVANEPFIGRSFIGQPFTSHSVTVSDPHPDADNRLVIVIRAPIFRDNRFEGQFVGIGDIADIIEGSAAPWSDRYAYNLRDHHGRIFWGPAKLPDCEEHCFIVAGDTRWQLSVAQLPTTGNPPTIGFLLIWGAGGALVLMATLHTCKTVNQHRSLRKAVAVKTRDLAASEAKYRAFMENASDAATVLDADRNIIEINRQAEILFGYARDELIGRSITELHPPEAQATLAAAFCDMDNHGTSRSEISIMTKSGRRVTLDVVGTRIPCGDTHVYLGSTRDISERKCLEAALRRKNEELEAFFSNLHVCLALMDGDFNFVRVNDAYVAAAGRPSDALIGRNHFELFPHGENEAIFRSVIASGKPYSVIAKSFEYPAQIARGTTYWDWMLTPLISAEERVGGVLLALIDVTERELQRQEVENAWRHAHDVLERLVTERTAELEAAYHELEAFSYSVSHDLHSPLRAINGFSHMLEQDYADALGPEARHYIARMRHATHRMGELIDGLLNLSQVFRSKLHIEHLDLSAFARDSAHMLASLDPSRAVEFRIQPELWTLGDPVLLRGLIHNLLSNAWKFTARKERAVIELGKTAHRNGPAFFVRDNGVGFEMDFAHKLFQPFERLHGEHEYEGMGIGLATVRRIVRRHGGEVWAESRLDEGAVFYFTLNENAGAALGNAT